MNTSTVVIPGSTSRVIRIVRYPGARASISWLPAGSESLGLNVPRPTTVAVSAAGAPSRRTSIRPGPEPGSVEGHTHSVPVRESSGPGTSGGCDVTPAKGAKDENAPPAAMQRANSMNHDGAGQNVLYNGAVTFQCCRSLLASNLLSVTPPMPMVVLMAVIPASANARQLSLSQNERLDRESLLAR